MHGLNKKNRSLLATTVSTLCGNHNNLSINTNQNAFNSVLTEHKQPVNHKRFGQYLAWCLGLGAMMPFTAFAAVNADNCNVSTGATTSTLHYKYLNGSTITSSTFTVNHTDNLRRTGATNDPAAFRYFKSGGVTTAIPSCVNNNTTDCTITDMQHEPPADGDYTITLFQGYTDKQATDSNLNGGVGELCQYTYDLTVSGDAYTRSNLVKQDYTAPAAPMITLPSVSGVDENSSNIAIADTINITDANDDNQTITITVTNGTVSVTTTNLTFTTGDGTDDSSMVFSGTLANVNAALDSMTFTPTANTSGSNTASIQIQADDGNSGTDDKTTTFDITDINPTISASTVLLAANSANDTPVATVTATTDTNGLTYSLTGGNTNNAFKIDNTGVITVNDASQLDVATKANYSLTVSLDDEDADSTADSTATVTVYLLDLTALSNTADTNNNGINDGLEDVFGSADTDTDGIPDALETLVGHDVDASTDTDSDGMPDIAEILLGRDPNTNDNISTDSPTITVATSPLALLSTSDVSAYTNSELGVSATESLTPVAYFKTGQCATTVPYNYPVVCNAVPASGFSSGVHKLWWLVADSDGNWGKSEQELTVLPQVSFAGDLVLAGNPGSSTVQTSLILNGLSAASAALNIPFTVSGTAANPAEHNLANGNFTFQTGATSSDPVIITLGNSPSNGSTIILDLTTSDAVFAQANGAIDPQVQFVGAGSKTSQTITISQAVYAPQLSAMLGTQGASPTQVQGIVFDKTQGTVTLSVAITDPDNGNYSYDWSNSNSGLLVDGGSTLTTSTSAAPVLDLSSLAAGKYYIEVAVTDSTAPDSPASKLGVMFSVLNSTVFSIDTDSDGDGKSDAEEGLNDTDGDGRPDYLDAHNNQANIAPTDGSQSQSYLANTSTGLKIITGSTAVSAGTGDIKITQAELAANGNKGQAVSNSSPDSTTLGHIFDYEIEGIDVPSENTVGNSASIVLPLDTALTANSQFLKYDSVNGWHDFTEDTNNSIAWATWLDNVAGNCPDIGSTDYSSDASLKEGKNCVKVTLQDGGANDVDGAVNGRVIDPLGITDVASTTTTTTPTTPTTTTPSTPSTATTSSGGGGSFGFLEWFMGLLLLIGTKKYALRRQADSQQGSTNKGEQ